MGAVLVALTVAAPALATQKTTYAGRRVADVLEALQQAGLTLIFSGELVPPTLRVKTEPRARTPHDIAREILAPHGLTLQRGPRGSWLVVALPRSTAGVPEPRPAPPAPAPGRRPVEPAAPPPPAPIRIEERVEVTDRLTAEGAKPGGYSIEPRAVRETAGGLENVFQVLQVLPGAVATNDEDGRLAVRGAGPEHNLVVLDGVQIHNPYRFSELTSSFLNPATAASITLDASGLDAAHGGRLSSVTIIETRDGTRDRRLAVSGSLGLASGDVLLEGRLPKTESGSWWVTARGTYYRPLVGFFRRDVLPSFGDVQFKLTARPSRRTRLSVFGLMGRETMHSQEYRIEGPDPVGARFEGNNRIGMLSFSWMPAPRLKTTTTLSLASHDARDFDSFTVQFQGGHLGPAGGVRPFDRRVDVQDFAARQRAAYTIAPGHVLDGGVEIHRLRSGWHMSGMKPPIFFRGLGPSTWGEGIEYPPVGALASQLTKTDLGAWLQDRLPIGSRLIVEPGVRLDWNSFTGESIPQPRFRVTAHVAGAAIWAGVAAQVQTPSHESLQGFDYVNLTAADANRLRNMRSRQAVVGFERGFGSGVDLRVEAYHRRFERLLVQRLETEAERALRLASYALPPDLPPDSAILEYRPTIVPESSGRGSASGIEVLVRRSGGRVNGWLGYTFSRTRRELYGHAFPADFDRPHVLSAAATVLLTRRLRASATWVRASGFPVTALHEEVVFVNQLRPDGTRDPVARPWRRSDGSLVMGPDPRMRRLSLRNTERLGGYSRTDLRVTYATLGRWEFYGEVINLFGSRNYEHTYSFDDPLALSPSPITNALNVYESFERLPAFGIRFSF